MKLRLLKTICIAVPFLQCSMSAQTLFVNFTNGGGSTAGFTDVGFDVATYSLGTSGGRTVGLAVTDAFVGVGTYNGTNASDAPTWFTSPAGATTQDDLTAASIGTNVSDSYGALTLSGFLISDTVTIELVGVKSDQSGANADFTFGGIVSTSGAASTNYKTSNLDDGFGEAMVWTLTGSTEYVLTMERLGGAPVISAMSVSVPEPASAGLLIGLGSALFLLARRS